mgnify:CR=1 FL=1
MLWLQFSSSSGSSVVKAEGWMCIEEGDLEKPLIWKCELAAWQNGFCAWHPAAAFETCTAQHSNAVNTPRAHAASRTQR